MPSAHYKRFAFGLHSGICPCKDCKERCAECHSSCVKYAKWDAIHKKKMKENSAKEYLKNLTNAYNGNTQKT